MRPRASACLRQQKINALSSGPATRSAKTHGSSIHWPNSRAPDGAIGVNAFLVSPARRRRLPLVECLVVTSVALLPIE